MTKTDHDDGSNDGKDDKNIHEEEEEEDEEEDEEEEDEEIASQFVPFYQRITDYSQSNNIKISFISLEGCDGSLGLLRQCSEKTGGSVTVLHPLELVRESRKLSQNPCHCHRSPKRWGQKKRREKDEPFLLSSSWTVPLVILLSSFTLLLPLGCLDQILSSVTCNDLNLTITHQGIIQSLFPFL